MNAMKNNKFFSGSTVAGIALDDNIKSLNFHDEGVGLFTNIGIIGCGFVGLANATLLLLNNKVFCGILTQKDWNWLQIT